MDPCKFLDDTVAFLADNALMCIIGSNVLPRLFGASLPLTLVAAPAASAFLGRSGVSRDRAVHQLYRILAASIVGEQSRHGFGNLLVSLKNCRTHSTSGNLACSLTLIIVAVQPESSWVVHIPTMQCRLCRIRYLALDSGRTSCSDSPV